MIVTFLDMDDEANKLNGAIIRDRKQLSQVLVQSREKEPFICQLRGENGFQIDVGIGKLGFVQYSRVDGEPPYLVAVALGKEQKQEEEEHETEFSCGGTATPISNRYCMPFELVRGIAEYFLATGRAHPDFAWEEI